MRIQRFGFALTAAALVTFGVAGCATKNYVRTQTTPLIDHTDQLDQKTADNNRQIKDVGDRAMVGIAHAQSSADTAQQDAQTASQAANTADAAANDVAHRADSLDSVDKGQLDTFAASLGSAKSYILEVTGGTDSVGSSQYNYDLSQRRADAVVQYLAAKYGVAPHRFYLIGIGKDQYVASNDTAAGRKENRRVQVQLLSNMSADAGSPSTTTTGQSGSGQVTSAPVPK